MGRHDITLNPFGNPSGSRTALATGLYASTPVLTATGWQTMASLAPGDLILTRDLGLTPIAASQTELRPALWSVRLPAGALGNDAPVMLPPGQPVLIESRFALPFCGECIALVPAMALEGWRGIAPHVPAQTEPILQLRLQRPAIGFIGPGVMVGFDSVDPIAFDLKQLLQAPTRPVLPLAAARHLVASLIAAEAGKSLRSGHATAWTPNRA